MVLVTHGHGGHVGDTAAISKQYGAKVAMNADMVHTFGLLKGRPEELVKGLAGYAGEVVVMQPGDKKSF